MKFDLRHRNWFPLVFAVGCIAVFIASLTFLSSDLSATITMLAALGGVTAFLYSKHSQEIQIFRELFREFNSRYDELNGRLYEIMRKGSGAPLSDDDVSILYDYFNLCVEEHLFFEAGCIDKRIWKSWEKGMNIFTENDEIRSLWIQELATDSYYGFKLPALNAEPQR